MSYKQILRRAARIIKSKLDDATEGVFSEKNYFDDFDTELKKERPQQKQSEAHSSKSQTNSGQKQSQQQEAKKRPGEQSDAVYLTILGLPANATGTQIKEAYKKMISQYHPDRVATLGAELQELASKKTKEINEAYQVLKKRRGM